MHLASIFFFLRMSKQNSALGSWNAKDKGDSETRMSTFMGEKCTETESQKTVC